MFKQNSAVSFNAIKNYLEQFRERLEPKPTGFKGVWRGRKSGSYKWYEIQDQVAYFAEFDKPKIFWAEIAKLPRFSLDQQGFFANNSCYFLISNELSIMTILAIMQSRISWFFISQIAIPLRLRAGLWQYKQFRQFVERLPIPKLTPDQERDLAAIAEEITALAGSRYKLHEALRQTISGDFGAGQPISTRVGLYNWWLLADDSALNEEIRRQFRVEIPLKRRAEWRDYLAEERAKHAGFTAQIVALETRLNAIVYDAFGLNEAERALIESASKYPYGEL